MDVSGLQVSISADISDFADAVNEIIDSLGQVADEIKNMADRFADAGSVVSSSGNDMAGSVTKAGETFMETMERSGKLSEAFTGLSQIFSLFGKTLGETPIGGIISLIAMLISVAVECYYKFDTFRAIVNAVWAVIKDLAIIVGDALIGEFKILYDITVWLIDVFKDLGSIVFTFLVTPIKLVIDAIQALYYAVVQQDWSKAWDSVKQFKSDIVDAAVSVKDSAVDIATHTKQMGENVANDFTEASQNILKISSGLTDDIANAYLNVGKKTEQLNDIKAKTKSITVLPQHVEVDISQSQIDVPDVNKSSVAQSSNQAATTNNAADAQGKLQQSIKKTNDAMAEQSQGAKMLGDALRSGITGIAESIGNVMSGKGNPLGDFVKLIGGAIKQMGEHLVSLALAFTAASAALPIFGKNAVAAGVAGGLMITLGTAMSAAKMASGGIVSGSTFANIGEYAGASHNPEVVAPLDKLKNMMGNNGPGGHYSFEIQGDRMVAMLQRQSDNTNFALGGQ